MQVDPIIFIGTLLVELFLGLYFQTFFLILHLIMVPAVMLGLYHKNTHRVCKSKKMLVGRTALVTGGTAGMGLEIAMDLAHRGAKVIIACPFSDEGFNAKKHIEKSSKSNKVVFKLLDLSSLESVRQFATDILKTEDRLDMLVNNAGIGDSQVKVTADGLPVLMQVNYFGPSLLTSLLLPLLKKTGTPSEPSRIVITTSITRKFAKIDFDTWLDAYSGSPILYRNSKMCSWMFAGELSRILKDENIVVNAVDPGMVGGTGIHKNLGIHGRFLALLFTILFMDPWEGAQTALFMLLSDEAGQVSGKCFRNCGIEENISDEKTASQLWKETAKLVRLRDEEWNYKLS